MKISLPALFRRRRENMLTGQVDQILLKAIETPVSKMTDDDWKDIRDKGRKIARKRNRHDPASSRAADTE
jgi:hypothetical protein